jgi:predicted dithiol-disulfide oxidoreductase (DUF899 family)
MARHTTGTREEWLAARLELLAAEKELSRQGDDVARRRHALPWLAVDNDYAFDTANGEATVTDLFHGRSQLIVYHFMFGLDWDEGCPSCSSVADGFNQTHLHLYSRRVHVWNRRSRIGRCRGGIGAWRFVPIGGGLRRLPASSRGRSASSRTNRCRPA